MANSIHLPFYSFYRYVIEPELRFLADGKASAGPYAKFLGLPASPLLTQNLQVPENWLVEVVRSVYDLDNIKLVDINGNLQASLSHSNAIVLYGGTFASQVPFTANTNSNTCCLKAIALIRRLVLRHVACNLFWAPKTNPLWSTPLSWQIWDTSS